MFLMTVKYCTQQFSMFELHHCHTYSNMSCTTGSLDVTYLPLFSSYNTVCIIHHKINKLCFNKNFCYLNKLRNVKLLDMLLNVA